MPTETRFVVYLGLGSNLGDRLANLQAAVQALEPRVHLIQASPVYETPPWGYLDQPDFLNQVIKVETDLTPANLLDFIKHLERELGREPTFRNGPRRIDIDILFYDDLILHEDQLQIPHPRLEKRAFVLVPLAAIAPNLRHPVLGSKIKELMEEIDGSEVILYEGD